MNSFLQIAFLATAVALLAGSLPAKTGRTVPPEQTLSVHLDNRAQVPAGVLHAATDEATQLFLAAGILITWEQPLAQAPEDRGADMSAAPGLCDERLYLVVRLIRRTPDSILPGALGFALPFARTGAHVLIFYDRVETLTRRADTSSNVILGHAIAHEIGHVLLRSGEHSRGGLMQAGWNAASWRLAYSGLLTFRPEEAKRMRAELWRLQVRYALPEPLTDPIYALR
jgi:hypothetical protein